VNLALSKPVETAPPFKPIYGGENVLDGNDGPEYASEYIDNP